jgi:hypothetical protein
MDNKIVYTDKMTEVLNNIERIRKLIIEGLPPRATGTLPPRATGALPPKAGGTVPPTTSSPTTVPTQSGDKGQVSTKKTNTVGGTNTIGTTKKSKYTYTKCSEQLPIKQYCKNETIRKVQACLKMPKRYQTGNFGPITQEYLESRNQNGTLITTETIINICGANHPLVPGVPYSSVPKTGYEDYTVDEIEYSNDVQNTKPSTPSSEKPEGEGTGYEGYSEEKPKPASPSTPKSASSFSSEIPGLQSSKKSFTNRTMDSDEIEH